MPGRDVARVVLIGLLLAVTSVANPAPGEARSSTQAPPEGAEGGSVKRFDPASLEAFYIAADKAAGVYGKERVVWATLSDEQGLLIYAPAFYGALSALEGMAGTLLVGNMAPSSMGACRRLMPASQCAVYPQDLASIAGGDDLDINKRGKAYRAYGWKKVMMMKMLVDKGYTTIWTDMDIVWFRSPMADLLSSPADVQVSIDKFISSPTLTTSGYLGVQQGKKGWQVFLAGVGKYTINIGILLIRPSQAGRDLCQSWILREHANPNENLRGDQLEFHKVVGDALAAGLPSSRVRMLNSTLYPNTLHRPRLTRARAQGRHLKRVARGGYGAEPWLG
eukprot:CAMPEP_0182898384 /NCGR_PEP_ID=MMETSP0034_2-20130328/27453_1 /TAXON_ID=156128 /ORGANISM="Nephroselmis pyriformis, Strain CCMP717" /LENGTH=334 /DNA_ID=CAMNT_0025032351 /DNA_START=77 /DNA_END=1077 /DNA_ORIENTATION=-